jgi:hypothetical protein
MAKQAVKGTQREQNLEVLFDEARAERHADNPTWRATGELLDVALCLADYGVLDVLVNLVKQNAKLCGISARGTLKEVSDRIDMEMFSSESALETKLRALPSGMGIYVRFDGRFARAK